MNKRGGNRNREEDPNVKVSKDLAYLLRHGAVKEGLKMDNAGYVKLDDILARSFYKSQSITEKIIREIVDTNDKKRFELKTEDDEKGNPVVYIRAAQGHSIQALDDEGLLTQLCDPSDVPICLHGTKREAWEIIKKEGLNKMNRNHIHFAMGFPGENGVISGMRSSCNVFIEVDVNKAMQDGIEFFLSSNNVVLSRGINGVILPKYFKKVTIKEKGNAPRVVDPKEYKGVPPKTDIEEVKQEAQNLIPNNNQSKESAMEEEKSFKADKPSAPVNLSEDEFEYLCVLDFEAQCQDGKRLEVQEIIELPVMIVDVRNRAILDEKFHYYIKPVVNPKLFPFCTKLTGITQDKVDNGILLQQALDELDEFLKAKNILKSRFCFVTCGDWDLNSCLKREAQAKNIKVREYLKSYINLKKVYPVPFGSNVKNPDMVEMLKLSGLPLIGRHHSGIDDVNNIARVVVYLLEKKFSFKKSLVSISNY